MAAIKINTVYSHLLRNDQHHQYGREFQALVTRTSQKLLNIEPQFDVWTQAFRYENEVAKKIVKSAFTENILEAGKARDRVFRSLWYHNQSMLLFFDSDVAAAATRLQIIFDTFGNIVRKKQTEKTGAYSQLIGELKHSSHAADVKATGIEIWMDELEKKNNNLAALMQHRYDESADKPDVDIKTIRESVDKAYCDIVERINALMLIEPSELYRLFIRRMNAIIEHYNSSVASNHRVRGNAREKTSVKK
jgi:hypothetical protein